MGRSVSVLIILGLALFLIPLLHPHFAQGQASQPSHCPAWDYPPANSDAVQFRPNPARVFPLCVQKEPDTGNYDPIIVKYGFDKVIDKINRDMNKDGWLTNPIYANFKYKPGKHFYVSDTYRQKMQDSVLRHKYDGNPSGPQWVIMDNWVHVELSNMRIHNGSVPSGYKPQIQGVYAQAIAGPLGIPFGEFVTGELNFLSYASGMYFAQRACGGYRCQDPPQRYIEDSRPFPCTFYSKAGLSVPQVLLWSTKATPANQREEPLQDHRITFTFRWDENACAEVSFFQFMFIFVYDFNTLDYHVGLSPMFQPFFRKAHITQTGTKVALFSTNGLAYPHFLDWDKDEVEYWNEMYYFALAEIDHPKDMRLVSNLEYEACVQHYVHLNLSAGSRRWECPPGPFNCDLTANPVRPSGPVALEEMKKQHFDEWKRIYKRYKVDRPNCTVTTPSTTTSTTSTTTTTTTTTSTTTTPTTSTTTATSTTSTTTTPTTSTTTTSTTTTSTSTTTTSTTTTPAPTTTAPGDGNLIPRKPPPPTTTPRPPRLADNTTNTAEESSGITEQLKKINHGELCTFVWMVLIQMANYIARYFTDFPNNRWIGLGWWMMLHVVMHELAILLMWLSFGLVVSNGHSFFGDASVMHYIYGFTALIIQHCLHYMGHQRSNTLHVATRQSYLHAVLGYVSTILSMFCAVTMHPWEPKAIIVYALFVVTVVFHLIASLIEVKIATGLGMFPARKLFPVLERVMMVNLKPRFWQIRVMLGTLYFALLTAVYFVYWFWEETRHDD